MIDAGQVNEAAAEVYDQFFVPALFGRWPPIVAAAAGIGRGMRVVDVACGTGALTMEAAARVGPTGCAVGIDINRGMLDIARRKSTEVDWVEGSADALPFESETVDAVISQFGLMFFPDPRAAVLEMSRVLKVEGVRVERLPGTAAFPSIRDWMHTDVRGWTLSDRIDDRQFERLVLEAERVLAEFVIADGSVRFSHPAIVATGTRGSA